jgi:thiamine-phosphate pyrophosphorylase
MHGYYFITDAALSRAGNHHDVTCAERAGVFMVQYRAKNLETRDMVEEALSLRRICVHTRLVINDRIDVALAVDADGVHIGQDDMPYAAARRILGSEKIIGVTVHSVEEAVAAQAQGADYVGVSPIFSTTTKRDAGAPAGLRLIGDVKRAVSIPVAAIGGINLSNAAAVVSAGADSLCAISAVVSTDDVSDAIKKFQLLFER